MARGLLRWSGLLLRRCLFFRENFVDNLQKGERGKRLVYEPDLGIEFEEPLCPVSGSSGHDNDGRVRPLLVDMERQIVSGHFRHVHVRQYQRDLALVLEELFQSLLPVGCMKRSIAALVRQDRFRELADIGAVVHDQDRFFLMQNVSLLKYGSYSLLFIRMCILSENSQNVNIYGINSGMMRYMVQ